MGCPLFEGVAGREPCDHASMLRIVVADDDLLVRRGVVAVLGLIDEVEVVAEAGDLPSLLDAVATHDPDVVVTDVRMPPTGTDEGVRAATSIRAERPSCGVVVLSQYAEPDHVLAVFEAGNERLAYLLKENVGDVGSLERAVRAVAAGGSHVDPAIVSVLVSVGRPADSALDGLTPREQEVLSLIAEGLNNAAIGERLVLSDRAVAKHINNIFAKLHLAEEPDAHRRVRAVLLWLAERA